MPPDRVQARSRFTSPLRAAASTASIGKASLRDKWSKTGASRVPPLKDDGISEHADREGG